MNIDYHLTGASRKLLAKAVGEITETKPNYLGVSSGTYQVGTYTIDKNGSLIGPDREDLEEELRMTYGFEGRKKGSDELGVEPPEIESLVIELPRSAFTEEAILNLKKLIESKERLIKRALGVKTLPLQFTEERILFPWFDFPVSSDEIKAYSAFITSLAKLAKDQKRVNMKAVKVDNEKYAFRCFLLRLGFIGDEYKTERKILLSKLRGSSAFRHPQERV